MEVGIAEGDMGTRVSSGWVEPKMQGALWEGFRSEGWVGEESSWVFLG